MTKLPRDHDKVLPVLSRCDGMAQDPGDVTQQIPCDGILWVDLEVTGGCDEPCRWQMRKEGEGVPPFELKLCVGDRIVEG